MHRCPYTHSCELLIGVHGIGGTPLVADAELIVYGATEPSASLFIGAAPVPLSSDGTFLVQVPFRDGQQVNPIRAVAADGEQERSIRLEFQRSTPEAQVNSKEEALMEWF